jgi:hypothetical protein
MWMKPLSDLFITKSNAPLLSSLCYNCYNSKELKKKDLEEAPDGYNATGLTGSR